MSGYIIAGYVISIGTLTAYGLSLAVRERAARRRVRTSLPADLEARLSEVPDRKSRGA